MSKHLLIDILWYVAGCNLLPLLAHTTSSPSLDSPSKTNSSLSLLLRCRGRNKTGVERERELGPAKKSKSDLFLISCPSSCLISQYFRPSCHPPKESSSLCIPAIPCSKCFFMSYNLLCWRREKISFFIPSLPLSLHRLSVTVNLCYYFFLFFAPLLYMLYGPRLTLCHRYLAWSCEALRQLFAHI